MKKIERDSYHVCTKCKGNGYIRGTLGNFGTCIYCHGSGHTLHEPELISIIKLCEDYVDGKQKKRWSQ